MDVDNSLQINGEALDLEWLAQPNLIMNFCREAAMAKASMDSAKEELEVVKAEVSFHIRENPDVYALVKVTEASIITALTMDQRVKAATAAFNEAKMENDLCQAAVRSMEHRKTALEMLVKLATMDYFSTPVAPLDITRPDKAAIKKQATERMKGAAAEKRSKE